MARKRRAAEPLPTIWRVPDGLWDRLVPILGKHDPPAKTGRKRVDPRAVLEAILFRLRTGCQWNHLPKEFPDDSSVHRTFQRWVDRGLFERLWKLLAEECEELGDLDWNWQAADGALGKARFGGTRSGRTRRTAEKTE